MEERYSVQSTNGTPVQQPDTRFSIPDSRAASEQTANAAADSLLAAPACTPLFRLASVFVPVYVQIGQRRFAFSARLFGCLPPSSAFHVSDSDPDFGILGHGGKINLRQAFAFFTTHNLGLYDYRR